MRRQRNGRKLSFENVLRGLFEHVPVALCHKINCYYLHLTPKTLSHVLPALVPLLPFTIFFSPLLQCVSRGSITSWPQRGHFRHLGSQDGAAGERGASTAAPFPFQGPAPGGPDLPERGQVGCHGEGTDNQTVYGAERDLRLFNPDSSNHQKSSISFLNFLNSGKFSLQTLCTWVMGHLIQTEEPLIINSHNCF